MYMYMYVYTYTYTYMYMYMYRYMYMYMYMYISFLYMHMHIYIYSHILKIWNYLISLCLWLMGEWEPYPPHFWAISPLNMSNLAEGSCRQRQDEGGVLETHWYQGSMCGRFCNQKKAWGDFTNNNWELFFLPTKIEKSPARFWGFNDFTIKPEDSTEKYGYYANFTNGMGGDIY